MSVSPKISFISYFYNYNILNFILTKLYDNFKTDRPSNHSTRPSEWNVWRFNYGPTHPSTSSGLVLFGFDCHCDSHYKLVLLSFGASSFRELERCWFSNCKSLQKQ